MGLTFKPARGRAGPVSALVGVLLLGGAWGRAGSCSGTAATAGATSRDGNVVIVLPSRVRDSMNVIFARFNEHWDELGDLNTLEKMLATVRPTQREYLGCLQGEVSGDTIRVESLALAKNLKQLPLAVAGDCTEHQRLIGTWHTHPYRADLQNLPMKTRALSAQDLETFSQSPFRATLVVWDADSVDAAVKGRDGEVQHPAVVITEASER